MTLAMPLCSEILFAYDTHFGMKGEIKKAWSYHAWVKVKGVGVFLSMLRNTEKKVFFEESNLQEIL